jgi:hypothetical protein
MIQSNVVRRVMRGRGASIGGTEDRAKVEPLAANRVQPIFDVSGFLLGTVIIGATHLRAILLLANNHAPPAAELDQCSVCNS